MHWSIAYAAEGIMAGKVATVSTPDATIVQEPLLEEQPGTVDAGGSTNRHVDDQEYVFESPSRRWWQGYANLYMGMCYIIVLWYALLHTSSGKMTFFSLICVVIPNL